MRLRNSFYVVLVFFSLTASAVTPDPRGCQLLLTDTLPRITSVTQALTQLSESLADVFGERDLTKESWYQLLNHFAVPNLATPSPLVVTSIIGGGNAGKSTLMNALPALIAGPSNSARPLSKTGWNAGMTQRMLIAAPHDPSEVVDADLRHRFGELNAWTSPEDVLRTGPGVLARQEAFPPNIAFVDAPDFDTGQPQNDLPDNLEQALRVICPSDALLAIFSPQTYKSQATIRRLADIFARYGRKKMILVFLGDPSINHDDVNRFLFSVAHTVFGDSADGLLGTYLMPYQTEVAQGLTNPSLVPVGGSPEFATLIQRMNAHPLDVKKYSLRSAIDLVVKEASQRLRAELKSEFSSELYAAALDALTKEVSKASVEDFPYHAVRKQIRESFIQKSSAFNRLLHRTNSIVATPEREAGSLIRHFTYRSVDPELQRELEHDHQWHDRVALTQFMLALQKRKIELASPDPQLEALAKRYERFFPEDKILVADNGRTMIQLPPDASLRPTVLSEIKKLEQADVQKLTEDLSSDLNRAQTESSTHQEISTVLARISQNQGLGYRFTNRALQILTLVVPACTASALANYGFYDTIVYLAVCNLAARPTNFLNNAYNDQYLSNRLNLWFHSLQENVTNHFINEKVTASLRAELQNTKTDKIRALRLIQASLKYLNQRYQEIPYTLRE